ncbi:hypothetical protein PWT90_01500 [Aphanocladium album]|nr:hypothetical protein PWT90_01500 [Aphanocladium album]
MASKSVLLLVDIQQGFDGTTHWGATRSTPTFEENVRKLLTAFRENKNATVLHVCHHSPFPASPLHPSKAGANFMECAAPVGDEQVFPKTTNSPFLETKVGDVIKDLKADRLVICGLMTAHCVSTTVRMASNLRLVEHSYGCVDKAGGPLGKAEIFLVDDATATFSVEYGGKTYDAESVHAIHLASMKDEFCDVTSTDNIVKMLKESK